MSVDCIVFGHWKLSDQQLSENCLTKQTAHISLHNIQQLVDVDLTQIKLLPSLKILTCIHILIKFTDHIL